MTESSRIIAAHLLRILCCLMSLGISSVMLDSVALAQDASSPVSTPRVSTQNAAQGSEVILNQVDTSAYPKVLIFATVMKGGVPVEKLTAQDFRVREDEVDQEPLTVNPRLSALNAIVTLDTSGSIRKALPDVQAAASSFIDVLSANDKVSVIGFAREVKLLSGSGDRTAAKQAISATVARGDTALYDAIYESIEKLKEVKGRKVAVVLSDGVDDNGEGKQLSKHSLAEALALAKQVNVPVFTVGLGAEIDESVLRKVAEETGGKYFLAPKSTDLKDLYDNIGRQLLGQYSIEYTSNLPADGSVHRVKLSQGSAYGIKEYVSPANTQATSVATTSVVTKTQEVVQVVVPPGLHVRAIPFEGAEPFTVDRISVKKDGQFEDGKEIASSNYNVSKWSTPLPAGNYVVIVKKGPVYSETKVTVPENEGKDLVVNLNLGSVTLIATVKQGGERIKADRFWVNRVLADGSEREYAGEYAAEIWKVLVPAGQITVNAKRDLGTVKKSLTVVAGQNYEEALNLESGSISFSAALVQGGPKVRANRLWISTPETAFEASRELGGDYSTDTLKRVLPAGKYRINAQVGVAQSYLDVDVTTANQTEAVIVMNAGALEVIVTAESGGPRLKTDFIAIKEKSDGFKDPATIKTEYNTDKLSTAIRAGEYVVVVKVGGVSHEVPVSIEAGKTLQQEIVMKK